MSHDTRRAVRRFLHRLAPVDRAQPTKRILALLLMATLTLSACQKQSARREVARGAQTQNAAQQSMTTTATTGPPSAQRAAHYDSRAWPVPNEAEQRRGDFDTESYSHIEENPFFEVARAPLSTFSVDVDTASYSNVRRFLNEGRLPPKDAVRTEELINYFAYNYPQPVGDAPFSVTAEVAACPWNARHRLVHVGLQGREVAREQLPPANLIFLVDVSGSMEEPNKLPLVQSSLRLLAEQLRPQDRVAVVVYAGSSGLVLPSTAGDRRGEIIAAVENLRAGGSTNGGDGIRLAYKVARENFIRGGLNRVILATDGDFNVGTTSEGELVRLIEEERRGGVFLSVLGFGTGNLKDSTMEKLADRGNGNYAYIDGLGEARKVLGQQLGGTLATIAQDVKIQVEFNPAQAAGYRLIGYENRTLREQDFNDDAKDAGEIGAGHSVTALYEVVPAGQKVPGAGVGPLKYQQPRELSGRAHGRELLTVKLRYKRPGADESRLLSVAAADRGAGLQSASDNFKFASAVAAFGLLLRDSRYKAGARFDDVLELARASTGADEQGRRREFLKLVQTAHALSLQSARN